MYDVILTVIVLNLISEMVEILFPAKKMKVAVRSFTSLLVLYVVCDYVGLLLI